MSLHRTSDVGLEAELAGDYAGLPALTGKMKVVAGKGFEPLTFGL